MRFPELTDDNFEQEVLKSTQPVIAYFSATWCGPCKAMNPLVEQVAEESPKVKFVKIDIDDCSEVSMRQGIRSVPTLYAFKDGQKKGSIIGLTMRDRIQQLVDRIS
ncbi:thioredoxin 1 [Spirosoma lacussanchae]|uniref:thioredoxin n=1 Tax=Spirosoma lacussanchae TaxID=1884249 RepID=UPI001109BCC2|nr:thioredoxin [Spirosoma lacussanchae]